MDVDGLGSPWAVPPMDWWSWVPWSSSYLQAPAFESLHPDVPGGRTTNSKKLTLSSPSCFWPWSLTPAVETLTKTTEVQLCVIPRPNCNIWRAKCTRHLAGQHVTLLASQPSWHSDSSVHVRLSSRKRTNLLGGGLAPESSDSHQPNRLAVWASAWALPFNPPLK